MSQPFDAARDLADAPQTGQRLRPRDAATLIVVRKGARPTVLMGRRAPGHVFMASKWVFPGGRIERADFTAAAASDLDPDSAARLQAEIAPRRARALALAAVRETFEETGLRLARPAPPVRTAGPATGIEIPLAVIGPCAALTDGLDTGESPATAQFCRDIARVDDLGPHSLSARTSLAIACHRSHAPFGNGGDRSATSTHE